MAQAILVGLLIVIALACSLIVTVVHMFGSISRLRSRRSYFRPNAVREDSSSNVLTGLFVAFQLPVVLSLGYLGISLIRALPYGSALFAVWLFGIFLAAWDRIEHERHQVAFGSTDIPAPLEMVQEQ